MNKKIPKSMQNKQILPNTTSRSSGILVCGGVDIFKQKRKYGLESQKKLEDREGSLHCNSAVWMVIHRLPIPDEEGKKRNVPSKS